MASSIFPSLEEMKATIANHQAQLAVAEQQLKMLYPDEGRIFTVSEKDVLALADGARPAFKKGWKRIVCEEDLVENVQRILLECRDYFLSDGGEDMGENFLAAAKKKMGDLNSKEWATFTLEVIAHLYEQGSFGDENDECGFDNFEDTAGGCDEVTQEAAIHVIEASM